ncbi:4-(cytidine 5'-diphospho)-2-C-methyl-D-erythritol kinase [Neisseria shayeganii]|uniref:4-diphosphocytidyl-2-C-methyl-D-erythritol kinase n=1 Tax=Neisseria shayeganii 871 TaxID=1032488 RepID=G4CK50_9NEIS|nr:4-(cytidine 5'-diphospho)-2-C-methyl-D-erythritol kinase [Neisseria shayeganii]EGY51777.1 4-(cytidine-5'-diphospho)-2-C-methyl-D-erythritol kinase [Neisseria shayeganii 871]
MNTPIPAAAQAFPAPAKLNLDLRIVGRRADGYHLLESIFRLVDLCDTVHLLPRPDGQIQLHTPADGVLPQQDLTYRAAALLQQASGSRQGADIWLEKRIPMGGGMGGGSSDAATVLMALNRLWQCGLSAEQLMPLGLQLGADVPFFIFGRNAFVRGIGEKLSEITLPAQWYVVVKPSVHVSTAVIFSHPGLTRDSEPSIMPSFQSLQPFRNDMQAVVLKEYTEVKQVFELMRLYGTPLMTGSGACIFLSFAEQKTAESVYKTVAQTHQAYCIRGLDRHPMFDM